MSTTYLAFPYRLDPVGRTSTTRSRDDHIEEMLEQLLFTSPGERVNRPDFGCGLLDLVFAANSPETAAGLTVVITAAVHQWLGDLIDVVALDVNAEDGALTVSLTYSVRADSSVATASFTTAARP